MLETKPQQVRWGPVDGKEAGVIVEGKFISWHKLEKEIMIKLLPQVEALNKYQTYKVIVKEHEGKKDWLVRITNSNGKEIGRIWFGPNPELPGTPYDGLVRVGKSFKPAVIWNTFQRYSDNSYRRIS